jgi:ergothioneine biosynthesis protein EgtB
MSWISIQGGIRSIGFDGEGFAYDNEGPRHKVYLNDYCLASRPVTNAEFMEFINDGGYQRPDYWLSDAWQKILQQHWQAPLYWEQRDGEWWTITLSGMQPVEKHAPVCHVSYYEAAAYARWCGARLPTEAEWENATAELPIEGNFRDNQLLQPAAAPSDGNLTQMFGDVWEWIQSPYTPYPGYCAESGPLGEYNGKFMSSQMVLRGGSCATPLDHIRPTYRNFFYPAERWQFSGFRLARDAK